MIDQLLKIGDSILLYLIYFVFFAGQWEALKYLYKKWKETR